MGCFDKTCCVSNTSISAGEQCLIIMLNKSEYKDFYDIRRNVWDQSERKTDDKFKLTEFEKKMVFEEHLLTEDYFLPIKDVLIGTYNDYGSIEENEKLPEDYEEYRMYQTEFYHIWAIEYLLGKPIKQLKKDKLKLVSELYVKMNWLRKSPQGLSLSGQQHKDIEEMKSILEFNKRTNTYLKEKIKEYENF